MVSNYIIYAFYFRSNNSSDSVAKIVLAFPSFKRKMGDSFDDIIGSHSFIATGNTVMLKQHIWCIIGTIF